MLEGQDHLDTTISVFKDGSRRQWHELDRDVLLHTVSWLCLWLLHCLLIPTELAQNLTGVEQGKGWRAL